MKKGFSTILVLLLAGVLVIALLGLLATTLKSKNLCGSSKAVRPRVLLNFTPEVDLYRSLSVSSNKIYYVSCYEIFSVSLDGGDKQKLVSSPLRVTEVVASPDDTMIAFSRQIPNQSYDYDDLFVMNLDSKAERLVFRGKDGYLLKPLAFSPDKKRLTFDQWDVRERKRTVMEIDLEKEEVSELANGFDFIGYSTDDTALFADSTSPRTIWKVNLETLTQAKVGELNLGRQEIYHISAASNEDKLIFTAQYGESSGVYSYQIFVSDFGGRNVKQLTNEADTVYIPVFTSDGSKVVYVKQYKNKKSIKIIDADGTNSRTVVEQES